MPTRRAWLSILLAWLVIAAIVYALTACSSPRIEYRAVPAWLIPERPVLPTIKADELACLAPDVYGRLARRERARKEEADALRALLGGGNDR